MEEMKEIAGQITVRNRNGWAGGHGEVGVRGWKGWDVIENWGEWVWRYEERGRERYVPGGELQFPTRSSMR